MCRTCTTNKDFPKNALLMKFRNDILIEGILNKRKSNVKWKLYRFKGNFDIYRYLVYKKD